MNELKEKIKNVFLSVSSIKEFDLLDNLILEIKQNGQISELDKIKLFELIEKYKKKLESKELGEIADKILTDYKYAFEVLGNGEI